MRLFFALILCFLLATTIIAQEESPTPYEIALRRIEEARVSGATELSLSTMELTELPPEIGELSQLRRLDLTVNQLHELPAELGNLSNLEILGVQGNQLTVLFPEIGNLTNLTDLALQGNQLQTLPSEIGQLHNLRYLEVSINQLTYLPQEISSLRSLHFLILSDNQLRALPAGLGNLPNLCLIDVRNNALTTLPETLANLPMFNIKNNVCLGGLLPTLQVDNNPLVSPPQEVIAQGTPAIFEYLRNEAWWHLQRLILGGTGFVSIVIIGLLTFRWRNLRRKGKRKNEEVLA